MDCIQHYKIIDKIDETKRSITYRGRKQGDKTPFIIKKFKTISSNPSEICVFKKEYDLIQKVALDGIVKTIEILDDSNCVAVVKENFDAEALKGRQLEPKAFLEIAVQLAKTLGYLHLQGIIHKDIRPHNIYVNRDGEVKITDFGIAFLLTHENEELYDPHVISNILPYISPEQTGRMNCEVDYRTDLYSLGITFYEMLTGEVPFCSDNPMEIIYSHIAKTPVIPSAPEPISAIIIKLLSKNTHERYQNAFGLKYDLEKCLKQLIGNGVIKSFELGRNDISSRFIIPEKLFGRENEIKTITSAFEIVSKGKQRMVLVSGSPGIGKSALINEIHKPVIEKNGYFLTGKYNQFRRDVPYSAIIQALQRMIRQILIESEDRIQKWRDEILASLGPNGSVITKIIPDIELLIGPQPKAHKIGLEEERNRFNLVFQSFIRVFTKNDHPIVLFLDDLQWADFASLQLLKNILQNREIKYLFVIGAYRDNEVFESHPLIQILKEITAHIDTIDRIRLKPIKEKDICNLIINFLKCSDDKGDSLGKLVHKKTHGNPFFIRQFLKNLYDEKLITFSAEYGWIWELDEINRMKVTDNVVDLLSSKMSKLPRLSQEVIKLCACIGNRFDIETLSLLLNKPVEKALEDITILKNEGFVRAAEKHYVFQHDRIHEAAYSLIPEDEKGPLHYIVGKFELDKANDEELQHKLLYIVDHLNLGSQMIIDEDQAELIKLNFEAAKKATASAAYIPASKYLNFASNLLKEDCWIKDYERTLEIYNESVEVEFLKGDYDEVDRLKEVVFANAKTVLDIVNVYIIRMKAFRSQQKFNEASSIGLEILNKLGYKIPIKPTKFNVLSNLLIVKWMLRGKNIEELESVEEIVDKKQLLIEEIIANLSIVAFYTSAELYSVVALKQMQNFIKYGITRIHAYGLGAFGVVSIVVLDDIDIGNKIGKLMLRLVDKYNATELRSKVINSYNLVFRHWKDHIKETVSDFKKGYQIGIESGDIEYGCLNLLMYDINKFFLGCDLNDFEKEIQKHYQIIYNLKQEHLLGLLCIIWQTVLNLLGRDNNSTLLTGSVLNAENSIQNWENNDTRTSLGGFYYFSLRLCYLFNDVDNGSEFLIKSDKYMDSLLATTIYRDFTYYSSLFKLLCFHTSTKKEQKKILKDVKKVIKKAKKYAYHCPENNLHWLHLIEAERANVLGKDTIAAEHYKLAVELSHKHEYLSEEALANELAGKFYLSRGDKKFAWVYMQEAYTCYRRWGAKAKLKYLEDTYPELIIKPQEESMISMPSLDVAAVMQASQAISSKIELDKLLTQMMLITVENAGAERGFLILENKGKLFVEAEIKKGEEPVLRSRPVETCHEFSLAIVNFAARTKEYVILENASAAGEFIRDEYVKKVHPKSILCTPILQKGKVTGILYLENNIAEGAFTKERIEVIKILTSQAAISFENARLYEEVQESEEKYRTILESIEDGYVECDLNGNILFVNDSMARISGYDREALINSNFREYIDRKDVKKALKVARNVYISGQPVKGFEFVAKQKDGAEINVDYATSLRRNADGNPIGFRGILRDITEKKQAENLKRERDIAKETAEAKSAFLANMSHEIRTPLSSITGFTALLHRTDMTDTQKKYADRIGKSSDHLMEIVNSILDLSKMEAGKFELESVDFRLHDIMEEIEAMFSELIPEEVQFKINIDEDVPNYLVGDPLKIKQILINLINNAKKFTKEGSITVTASLDDSPLTDQEVRLCFSVEDTGMGIPSEKLSDLFSPYTQTDASTARKFGGTGIGLSISKGFVEMMGGEIRAESEEGEGAKFYFTLNLTRRAELPGQPEADTMQIMDTVTIDLKGIRVLLAEDEQINRELTVTLLNYFGVAVTCVSNGKEALDAVNADQFDAVIMDMQMPVMDGIKATQAIKENPKHKTLPVIALTGNTSSEEREKCINSGMVGFVSKPLDEDNIYSALSTALASAKSGMPTVG